MSTALNCKVPVLSKGQHIMTSDYGMRTLTVNGKTQTKLHKGVDLVGGGHTLDYVIAFADGTVKAAKYQSSMGYYVQIDHGNGYVTRYMHMKKGSLTVKAGQAVKKGQVLGYMGATGNVTGAHLHFDICINGEYIDPKPYLKGEKAFVKASSNKYSEAIKEFQAAAIKDGIKMKKGANGWWGAESENAAKTGVVKKRLVYRYKNLTRIVQRIVGTRIDGYCGNNTANAIKNWQANNGLAVDGAFGPACWKAYLEIE
ncbi:MAG: peptidoglycan DD-metalloendopeptidase family protein [Clostridia bacterium]|nr:peptidoglycan DD-metalloendopeptidase family protein [Clostridia bacterium]